MTVGFFGEELRQLLLEAVPALAKLHNGMIEVVEPLREPARPDPQFRRQPLRRDVLSRVRPLWIGRQQWLVVVARWRLVRPTVVAVSRQNGPQVTPHRLRHRVGINKRRMRLRLRDFGRRWRRKRFMLANEARKLGEWIKLKRELDSRKPDDDLE